MFGGELKDNAEVHHDDAVAVPTTTSDKKETQHHFIGMEQLMLCIESGFGNLRVAVAYVLLGIFTDMPASTVQNTNLLQNSINFSAYCDII
jgi:hypothetical protein